MKTQKDMLSMTHLFLCDIFMMFIWNVHLGINMFTLPLHLGATSIKDTLMIHGCNTNLS